MLLLLLFHFYYGDIAEGMTIDYNSRTCKFFCSPTSAGLAVVHC